MLARWHSLSGRVAPNGGLAERLEARAESPPAETTRAAASPARLPRLHHHLRGPLAAALALLAIGLLPVAAHADVTIKSFQTGPSSTQAGGHPDLDFSFELSTRQDSSAALNPCACGDAKDIAVHLPTGLIGNPHATPQCDIAQFSDDLCPVDSQVGVAQGTLDIQGGTSPLAAIFVSPVYNLIPPPGEPGLLAFKATNAGAPIFEVLSARTGGDYGLDSTTTSINHAAPLNFFQQVVWGLPADPIHGNLRFAFGESSILLLATETTRVLCDAQGDYSTADPATVFELCLPRSYVKKEISVAGEQGFPIPSYNSPATPFTQNPTTCGVSSLSTSIDVTSYDGGASHADSSWPATTDCDQLSFNPSQAIAPTTTAADSASGADFTLTVPQFESPTVPSPSELRAATVTLPPGYTLAPNVTNGKTTCSDAQARFGTTEEAHCPEDSKIGTIAVETPVLPAPLTGAVYLGEPKPGNRFRMILVFDGFGVHVKLPGTVTPDPQTGQISISFQNLPQAPFARFTAHIFGSERGPLATPTQCGTYPLSTVFSPWDSALSDETSRQFFAIDQGPSGRPCPGPQRPFNPGFQAASAANTAGAHTAFSLDLTREDGDQNLASLKVTTPPGFTATLKGLTYCPQAAISAAAFESHTGLQEQANPSCPASSLLGEVVAGAGAGSHPLYLPGKVYLAGPYQGAPLSFVFITPAVSAGYDLGNVVVREAIDVNPETAQVTTAGAPLPQIFAGIPLRLRQIMVNLNRPGFALNPTNCEPLAVGAQVLGTEGALSNLSNHFQVADCAALPFAPRLSLKLTGGVHRLGHPAIHAVLTTQPGEANPSAISVTLPPNETIDNAHFGSVCTRVDFAKQACPAGSLLGHAEVTSPLLDQPLTGNAYLRSSAKGLPDLALDLYGQIHIEAVAHIDSVNGGLRTTFHTVPDVPLGTVALNLQGGSKGLVQDSESLCGHNFKANVLISGQNGKRLQRSVPLQAACGKAAKHKRKVHKARRAAR